jgi:hypothetical protein
MEVRVDGQIVLVTRSTQGVGFPVARAGARHRLGEGKA